MQKQKQKTKVRFLLSLAAITSVALFIVLAVFRHASVTAATGTNEQLNYQARLLTDGGAVVPDGLYNIRFRIYQDGDGVLGGGDETLAWTEARTGASRVTVKNGYFSIYLGSVTPFNDSVDWNQDTLWMSIDIGGTGGSPAYDGEMSPFTRLSSSPYALNSAALGGLTSDNFVQLAQGLQTDSDGAASIHINDTGGGNLLHLLSGGTDRFTISNTGTIAAATAADTINGIIINAGAISGVAGFSQDSGNFDASASSGTFATSTGAVSLNGNTTVTGSNTFTVGTGLTTLSGGLTTTGTVALNTTGTANTSIGNGSGTFALTSSGVNITSGGAVSGATTLSASGLISGGSLSAANGLDLVCAGSERLQSANVADGILLGGVCQGGISDQALKQNVASLNNNVLDKIKDVNAVSFDYDCTNLIFQQNGGKYWCDPETSTGVIAQELALIFPELVYQGGDGYYRVKYEQLGIYTLKAVQELAGIVDSSGDAVLNSLTVNGQLLVTSGGALQNLTGLSVSSGGASITGGLTVTSNGANITGGINNNSGGITNTGAVAGVTTLGLSGTLTSSGNISTTGNIFTTGTGTITSNGTLTASAGLTITTGGSTISAGNLSLVTGSLATNSVTRLTNAGALQNITGLTIISGGASITGGINNNSGGITNTGAISGATTITASGNINTTSGVIQTNSITRLTNNGALQDITGLTIISGGASIAGGATISTGNLAIATGALATNGTTRLTNAGALQNITGLTIASGGASITGGLNNNSGGVTNAGAVIGVSTLSASGNITTSSGVFQIGSSPGIGGTCTGNNSYLQDWTFTGGILTAGTCRSGGVLSDERLKENVVSLDDSIWQDIRRINTVTFDFKCEDPTYAELYLDCDRQTGVIAQQLAEVFPELVYIEADGYYRVNYEALNIYTLKAVTQLAQVINIENNRIVFNTASRAGLTILGDNGAELFAIDDQGNATFNGTITAENSVNQTQVLAAIDQQLANAFGTGLEISGYSAFNADVDFNALVAFAEEVTFAKQVVFEGRVMFNNDTGGFATIEHGDQEVRIEFNQSFAGIPTVNVSNIDGQFTPYTYKDLDETGFTIVLQLPAAQDIKFSWTALAIDNALTQLSGDDILDN